MGLRFLCCLQEEIEVANETRNETDLVASQERNRNNKLLDTNQTLMRENADLEARLRRHEFDAEQELSARKRNAAQANELNEVEGAKACIQLLCWFFLAAKSRGIASRGTQTHAGTTQTRAECAQVAGKGGKQADRQLNI